MKRLTIGHVPLSGDPLRVGCIHQAVEALGYEVTFVPLESQGEETPCNVLFLEVQPMHWGWLDTLLWHRRRFPHTPVLLLVPSMTLPGGFTSLSADASVFLANSVDTVKAHFRTVIDALDAPRKQILFVDDDTNILEAYARALRKSPWRLLTVSNANQALNIVRLGNPDLVVTDIKMPGLHGFALINEIRKYNKHLPIIICSAYHGLREEADMYFHNVAAFFEKPVQMSDLEAKIRAIVG